MPAPPLDTFSPNPSAMPPPNLKRPRASNAGSVASGQASGTPTVAPRAKRRKPEVFNGDGDDKKDGRGGGAAVGRGKEEDMGPDGDVVSRIDFNKLPVETLYKYLEAHDLLPGWEISPWSEQPCIPPNALYSLAPAATVPTSSPKGSPSSLPSDPTQPTQSAQAFQISTETSTAPPEPTALPGSIPAEPPLPLDEEMTDPNPSPNPGISGESDPSLPLAAPTTRSKTLPQRKPLTPPLTSSPPKEIKRGVITLSDVYTAREVLAEKANAHWVKGLGGGQNKEGETIVNFLYKMKVGPDRLLRVYNPNPATYP